MKGGVPVLLRNRIRCRLEESSDIIDVTTALERDMTINETENVSANESLALNEVVINRGPSPFLSNLELYVNDYLITTVQGDGLIISTPTGSTAYAMAAGASMSHPSVCSITIAPICPHSLSFRPIVVPAGVELKVRLAEDARCTAWYYIFLISFKSRSNLNANNVNINIRNLWVLLTAFERNSINEYDLEAKILKSFIPPKKFET